MPDQPRIELFRTPRGWMATFHHDAEVQRAFSTDTIPTPFTAQADADDVLREIRRLNPNHVVSLRDQPLAIAV